VLEFAEGGTMSDSLTREQVEQLIARFRDSPNEYLRNCFMPISDTDAALRQQLAEKDRAIHAIDNDRNNIQLAHDVLRQRVEKCYWLACDDLLAALSPRRTR